mmetsp:Transcript_3166/g.11462  ORF Transcript_3166/g.11462 Transcript_3166/m.11462 type:complete len:288 (-) Transcript_3166:122-985(-)
MHHFEKGVFERFAFVEEHPVLDLGLLDGAHDEGCAVVSPHKGSESSRLSKIDAVVGQTIRSVKDQARFARGKERMLPATKRVVLLRHLVQILPKRAKHNRERAPRPLEVQQQLKEARDEKDILAVQARLERRGRPHHLLRQLQRRHELVASRAEPIPGLTFERETVLKLLAPDLVLPPWEEAVEQLHVAHEVILRPPNRRLVRDGPELARRRHLSAPRRSREHGVADVRNRLSGDGVAHQNGLVHVQVDGQVQARGSWRLCKRFRLLHSNLSLRRFPNSCVGSLCRR